MVVVKQTTNIWNNYYPLAYFGKKKSFRFLQLPSFLRVRTHYQNFAFLIICNKIVTLLKINVPSRQINVPPCQINDPTSQINVPHCQKNVPLANKCPKFLRQNHDPRDNYLQEGHIFVSLFDHVYAWSQKSAPNPQIWIKNLPQTHFFVTNLRFRGTFLTPCVRTLNEEHFEVDKRKANKSSLSNVVALVSNKLTVNLEADLTGQISTGVVVWH